MLSSRWNFNRHVTIKCFNYKVAAQHCLSNVQIQISVNIGTFSLKVGMWAHLYMYYQVTSWTILSGVPFLGDTEIYTIVDALRDINCLFCVTMCGASTPASDARISDYFPNAIAVTTDLLDHEGTLPNGLKALTATTTTS